MLDSLEPPRRGGSNEYPQSMFLSRNKKKKQQFYYIKVGFKGVKIILACFRDAHVTHSERYASGNKKKTLSYADNKCQNQTVLPCILIRIPAVRRNILQ